MYIIIDSLFKLGHYSYIASVGPLAFVYLKCVLAQCVGQ